MFGDLKAILSDTLPANRQGASDELHVELQNTMERGSAHQHGGPHVRGGAPALGDLLQVAQAELCHHRWVHVQQRPHQRARLLAQGLRAEYSFDWTCVQSRYDSGMSLLEAARGTLRDNGCYLRIVAARIQWLIGQIVGC
jgi:hypothetical protein